MHYKDVHAFLHYAEKKKIYSPKKNWKQIYKNSLNINFLFCKTCKRHTEEQWEDGESSLLDGMQSFL